MAALMHAPDCKCVAWTGYSRWAIKGNYRRCRSIARILVNGKNLCIKHGRIEALAVMIRKKMVKEIPGVPRTDYRDGVPTRHPDG